MKIREITLIIICTFFCISASVVSKNTFILAKPKQFFFKANKGTSDAVKECYVLSKNGWQNIKIQEIHYDGYLIVTAEKY